MRALILGGLLLAATPALAQTEVPTGQANGPAPIDLRSEKLTVEHARRRAIFSGGVVATRGELTMQCPEVEARYDASSRVQTVTCVGPVTATEGDRTMTAEHGRFDNETGILTLEGQPTLTEGERRLTGETLIYEASTGLVRLQKAEGLLPATDAPSLPGAAGNGPLRVSADTIEHDFAKRRTSFSGGVVATRGDLALQTPRLVALYDEHDQLAQAFTSGGPVTVRQRDRRGRADKAVFTQGARTLVLQGNPTVTDNGSSLAGTKVTFLLGQDRVEVEKPRAVFPLQTALPGGQK